MSKKLAAKASMIQFPGDSPAPAAAPPAEAPTEVRSRTAPGTMAHFLVAQSAVTGEVESLRSELKKFDGAVPTRKLDPKIIRRSRWANRHAAAFADQAYEDLKGEIESSGGNVQPIKVRPLPAPDEHGCEFEIVFGHRRHRVCLELGYPVLSVIEAMDDQRLFAEMERENRTRASLSPWEQGMMYRRALDEGLFPSQRRLSDALGVDLALVSKSLMVARLPDAVVDAFESPLVIQYRWAQPLSEAVQRDPDGMLQRARAIAAQAGPRLARAVLEQLLGGPSRSAAVQAGPVQIGDGKLAVVWQAGPKGAVRIDIPAGALTAKQLAALQDWFKRALTPG